MEFRLRRRAALPFLLACMLSAGVCLGEEKIVGSWGDQSGANVYLFGKDGEFEYRLKVTSAAGGRTPAGAEKEPTAYERSSGVWTSGKGICSTGLQKGDLMIYVDEMQCCMMTQAVAGKLVLNAVFSRGHEDMSICRNRVLGRLEESPDASKTGK